MEEKEIALRIAQLRVKKGVSAREMSLSMGQNPGYINSIESGRSLPSLPGLLYICDYLNITLSDFLDLESKNLSKIDMIVEDLKKLDDKQLETISNLIKDLTRK